MKLQLVLTATVVLVLGADTPPDREGIEGTWAYAAAERDGKPVEEAPGARTHQWVFKGDRVYTTAGDLTLEMAFLLTPDKSPKSIDLTGVSAPIRTRRHLYLYQLDGNTLRICTGPSPVKRPTDFTSEHGQTILTFKRGKN